MKKKKLKRLLKDTETYSYLQATEIADQNKRLHFLVAESAKRERFLKDAITLISGIRQTHVLNPAAIKVALKELCDKYQYPI